MSALPKFDAVHEAMLTRGFVQAAVLRPLVYAGRFEVSGELIVVTVEFFDLELQQLPTIRIKERPAWIPPDCNHVTANNTVCYASPKLAFIDRYDADRQVLYCLNAAAKVLLDIKRGNVLGDVDGEFAYYWKGDCLLIDAEARDDLELLRVVTLKLPGRELPLVCSASDDALTKYAAFSPRETRLSAAVLLAAERTPPADTKSWPPRTLQQLMRWLTASAPNIARAVRRALAGLHGRHASHTLIVVQAKPTWFAFSFALPFDARKVPFRHEKDFVNSILTKGARIDLERHTPFRVDSRYLVERNLRDSEHSLLGKRILLAGCGAIGGHVGHALARIGAGYGGGSLTLADPDIFTSGNIGRHRLGIEAFIEGKADALARDLRRSLPGIDVRPISRSVLELPLESFDLIVDATAEEQLSEALNARFLAHKCAPIVFVWINGNGAAAQSFTLAGQQQGCLHCWKSHGDRANFDPVKASSLEVRTGYGCDDPYAPFSGAAPLVAAGLVTQAVLDWASGRPNPTLRTAQIDYHDTRIIKPKTPAKTQTCPACGPAR